MGIILIPILFLLVAYFWARAVDRRHFSSIVEREAQYADITVSDLRSPPGAVEPQSGKMVTGATVVANDYFKNWAASIRNIFGGEVRGLQVMLERARREAVLRMLAEAREMGADAVYNLRIDTSTISGKRVKRPSGIEVLASGTAVKGGE